MNLQDSVMYLAHMNSRYSPRREDEVDKSIPYFQIHKNDMQRYDITSYGYTLHDNAPRMQLWESYLKTYIFPNINPTVDISGYYNIELHDSYTYLNNGKDYKNVLCFSKFKNDTAPILIPDPYMICNYGGMNDINDDLDWSKKKNKVVFCGTTTGNQDPSKNERLKLCQWSLSNRNWCDFYITKVAQMQNKDVHAKIPEFFEFYRDPLSIQEQLQYKYHLAVDGNTCRFDTWYYKANNVVLKYDSKEMLWYYPLLQNEVHYFDVNKDNMKSKIEFLNNNPQNAYCTIYNAKKLSQMLYRPIVHQMYTIHLFENMAQNK